MGTEIFDNLINEDKKWHIKNFKKVISKTNFDKKIKNDVI